MKKICILAINSLKLKDGVSRTISNIAYCLKDKIVILTNEYNKSSTYKFPKQTKIYEKLTVSRKFPFMWAILPQNFISVSRFLKKENIYIINSHAGLIGLLFLCILKLIFYQKLKISSFIYDIEELCKTGIKKIVLNLINFLVREKAVNIIVLDNRMKKLSEEKFKSENTKIHVVRIGVSKTILEYEKHKEKLKPTKKLLLKLNKISPKSFKILFFGILIPRRRVEDLLKAINLLKSDYPFIKVKVIIGGSTKVDKDYVNKLYKLTKELNLNEDIVFVGEVSEKELAYLYKFCDAFVWPCYPQTWGIAPLEAMLFGKPVIVSTGSGVSEVLNKKTAILIPPKKPKYIEMAILKLFKDKKTYQALSKNGRDFVLKNLTYINTGNELSKVLDTN
jgi:glycosyltransferase involved in cell wall biosynthesis